MQLEVGVVVSPVFGENCYIVWRNGETDCLVIDPGIDPETIQQFITDRRLKVVAIINTHGHADHIAGNEFMKRCWPDAPLVIGAGDADKLGDAQANLSAPFGMAVVSPPADGLLREGEPYAAAGIPFEIRDTPGHSAGHVVLICHDTTPTIVFGGDVLFREGIGRTDFPDGSFPELKESIDSKLFTLAADTLIYPGHGEETTVGHEQKYNPFLQQLS